MTKKTIAVTGGNGLVGSHFLAHSPDFTFVTLDISDPVSPVDITNESQVMAALDGKKIDAIVHFAAFTDVTAAWKQSGDRSGIVYKVNVTGTEVMARAARTVGAQLIHISTAYVFDGEKQERYTEADTPNPIEWYGETKLLAEQAVRSQGDDWTILRIDQPFRQDAFAKPDALHRILTGLQAGTLYPQFTDHWFGPTFIPDFTQVLQQVIETHSTGLYHASSGEMWSDFEFAQAVAEANGFDPAVVKAGSLAEYLKTTERPYQRNTAMDTQKLLDQLDLEPQAVAAVLAAS